MNIQTCNEQHTVMAGATNILQKRCRNGHETYGGFGTIGLTYRDSFLKKIN